ncbi:defensin-like protein 14 [Capsella rubella]|uniref:defensin-like protein 14 n=1 Tax=Capsella rubella TaxID=81985 RepID=UPI000CD5C007|nr:defensin-like protein 14 [Capsella rubella]
MVKFAFIITVLFAAFFIFAAIEAPTMVEAQKLCGRPSTGTMRDICRFSNFACRDHCTRVEGAKHGSCSFVFPINKCSCFFPC